MREKLDIVGVDEMIQLRVNNYYSTGEYIKPDVADTLQETKYGQWAMG